MAFSEFDIHMHMFTFSSQDFSLRFGMSALFSYYSQPASHWGSCREGCYTPKIPQVVLKKDQLPPPWGPGHHSRSRAPNTTDLPGADEPGSAKYEHEDEAEDGFWRCCSLKNRAAAVLL